MKLDPPIKSLFVFCTNPVSQSPETNKIVEGLKREDLFTVVAEHFITDTAKYADIILPAAMAGEAEDMMWSWGHFYFTYNQKAVDPPGECKPTSDMWRLLAAEMGFDDPVFKMTDSELCEAYINWADPKMGGIDMDYFKEHGYYGSTSVRSIRVRRTPRASIPRLRARWSCCSTGPGTSSPPPFRAMYEGEQDGTLLDPLPGYSRCANLPETNPELAKRYPLNIISPKSHAFLNSCYANEPHKIKLQGEQFVMISPVGCGEAQHPRGRSRAGEERPRRLRRRRAGDRRRQSRHRRGDARLLAPLNRSDGSVNSISSDAWSGIGRAPTFSDNLVEVSRVN